MFRIHQAESARVHHSINARWWAARHFSPAVFTPSIIKNEAICFQLLWERTANESPVPLHCQPQRDTCVAALSIEKMACTLRLWFRFSLPVKAHWAGLQLLRSQSQIYGVRSERESKWRARRIVRHGLLRVHWPRSLKQGDSCLIVCRSTAAGGLAWISMSKAAAFSPANGKKICKLLTAHLVRRGGHRTRVFSPSFFDHSRRVIKRGGDSQVTTNLYTATSLCSQHIHVSRVGKRAVNKDVKNPSGNTVEPFALNICKRFLIYIMCKCRAEI